MPPKPPYDWDATKAASNLEKHGVPFEDVYRFDWAGAIEAEDTRYDYGEMRMQALGKIDDRYHVLVYAPRGDTIRVISLRKANPRELK
ncbi:MAG: BrnT family toxin [Rhodobacter sp.]|nr:BrnT family toxin [Rhodobacter sp.]